MRDRIARSLVWVVWSRGVVQILSLASTLLVARLLTPEDYGVMALAAMWTYIILMVAELGLGAAIVQFRDLDERELNTCFWLTLGLAGFGYFVLYAAAPAIGAWFGNPTLSPVLRVLGLTLPLAALRAVPDAMLRKRLELDKVSKAEIASAVAAMPLVLGTAWAGGGVWALVAGALIVPLVQGAMTFRFVGWSPGLRIGGSRLPSIIRYSLAALGARLCWALYYEADTFVLGKVAGGAVLGFYSMAKQLALLPVDKIYLVVNQLAPPLMAELQADRHAMGTALLRGLRLVAWTTFPMTIGLALVAGDLVHIALTDKWSPAVPIIYVLCIYAAIRSVALLLPSVLMAQYRARFVFGYNVLLLGLMPVAFWIGARWAGAIGVAAAWALVYPIPVIWMASEALRGVEVSWKTLCIELGRPLAATLLLVAAMVAANWALASWVVVGRLAVTSLAGAAAYAVGLWKFGRPVHREIEQMTRWVLRRDVPSRIPAATMSVLPSSRR